MFGVINILSIFALIASVYCNDSNIVNIVNDVTHIFVNAAHDKEYHLIEKHFDEDVHACLCGVCHDSKDSFKVNIANYFKQLKHPSLTEAPINLVINTNYFSYTYNAYWSSDQGEIHSNGQIWGKLKNNKVIEYHRECIAIQSTHLLSLFGGIDINPKSNIMKSFDTLVRHEYELFSNLFTKEGSLLIPGLIDVKGPYAIKQIISKLITKYGDFDMQHLQFSEVNELAGDGGGGYGHWSAVFKPNFHTDTHYIEIDEPNVIAPDEDEEKNEEEEEESLPVPLPVPLPPKRSNKLILKNEHCSVIIHGYTLLNLDKTDGKIKEMVC